jgi:predicted  nucleic acid-binding Zn-ribbon protein
MSNIQIESDLKEVFNKFEQKLDKLDDKLDKLSEDVTMLKVGQAKIEGKIEAIDEKLSGQIRTLDEKVSGKIEATDTKAEQLEKRIGNQEFFNRIIGGSLVVSILSGIAGFFWMAIKLR